MQERLFSALGLSPEILKAVSALGFEEASPIQAAAIPVIMQGKDLVGQSQTGSGKTAAFAIPAIEASDPKNLKVQALVLCPTRELATQVAEQVHKLAAYKRGINAVPIYGGASYDRQFYELRKGVQIVIGTPGRLIDHLDRGTLKLDELKMVILDEADRMLDMGFRDDIQRILDATPAERQTIFFSATVSAQIRQLIKKYARDPETISIEQKALTVPTVEQTFYEVPSRFKRESLIRLIDFHQYKLGIIFCNTQRMVDELADTLLAQGISADRLHGGISQAQRTRVMNKFKNAEFEFLVATDVAGRGIDVDDLELVVNYDLPYDPEDYVHRIGRTGRAGRAGMAVTFVSGREVYKLQQIERFTRIRMRRSNIPTVGEIEERRADQLFDQIRTTLEKGDFKSQSVFVERLLDLGFSPTDIASSLLHQLIGASGSTSDKKKSPAAAKKSPAAPAKANFANDDLPPRYPKKEAFKKDRPDSDSNFANREPADSEKPKGNLQWVVLNAGRAEGMMPPEIVDLLAASSGLPHRTVGRIDIAPHESYAQVFTSAVEKMIRAVNGSDFDGRQLTLQRADHYQPAPLPRGKSTGNKKKKKDRY